MGLVLALSVVGPAEALQLNPLDFSSLGTLNATTDIIINSDTLQLSGGASFTGVLDSTSHAAVFTFDNIQSGSISIQGSRPLAILSKGNASFDGPISSSIPSELQIATAGTISLTNVVLSPGGGILTILADDVQLSGGGRIVSGGNLTLATVRGLTPHTVIGGQASVGTLTTGQSGGAILSWSAFNIPPGEVQLFTGGISLPGSTIVPRGVTFASSQGVIVGVAPVPLPAAAILFGTGLGALALTRGRRMPSQA